MKLIRYIRRLWSWGAGRGKRVTYPVLGVGILFLGIASAFLLMGEREGARADPGLARDSLLEAAASSPAGQTEDQGPGRDEAPGEVVKAGPTEGEVFRVLAFLNKLAGQIENASGATEALALTEELREFLAGADIASAATALVAFLDSGRDVSTGLSFMVRPDGFLDAGPSLRVTLLDELEKLSAAVAAEYARKILDEATSPDEWAVALRGLGRGRLPSALAVDDYFSGKLDELLHHDEWLDDPTIGFLQAFDAVVYRGGTRFVPRLAEMLGDEVSPAVQYGAGLALDRLVMEDFAGVIEELQGVDPALWNGQDTHRARLFARADVRDARQRGLVEGYLLDPAVPEEEVSAFARLFPYFDVEVSNNLFTGQHLESFSVLLEKDRAALEVVREWRRDPRFSFQAEAIDELESRLEEFVASGKRGLE